MFHEKTYSLPYCISPPPTKFKRNFKNTSFETPWQVLNILIGASGQTAKQTAAQIQSKVKWLARELLRTIGRTRHWLWRNQKLRFRVFLVPPIARQVWKFPLVHCSFSVSDCSMVNIRLSQLNTSQHSVGEYQLNAVIQRPLNSTVSTIVMVSQSFFIVQWAPTCIWLQASANN